MEGSVTLTMSDKDFYKLQKRIFRYKAWGIGFYFNPKTKAPHGYTTPKAIYYPECRFPRKAFNKLSFEKLSFEARKSYPKDIIKKSPFFNLMLCPNLTRYFRSHEVFWFMAKQVAEHPHVKANREVRLLYPGSGAHIAPLDLFHNLIQQGKIDRASAIFTEVDINSLSRIRILLDGLASRGIYKKLKEKPPKNRLGGRKTVFTFEYKNKPISLTFAFKMSGKKYYSDKQLKRAPEVVVIHDSSGIFGSMSFSLLETLIKSISSIKAIKHPPLIIMENFNHEYLSANKGTISTEPYIGKKEVIPFPYGHRDKKTLKVKKLPFIFTELVSPLYGSAILYKPDLKFWRLFSHAEIDAYFETFDKLDKLNKYGIMSEFEINIDGITITLQNIKDKDPVLSKVNPDKIVKGFKEYCHNFFGRIFNLINKIKKDCPKTALMIETKAKKVFKELKQKYPYLSDVVKKKYPDQIKHLMSKH